MGLQVDKFFMFSLAGAEPEDALARKEWALYNSLKFLDRNYDASGYDDSMLDDDDANADQESANVQSPVMSMVRQLAPDRNKPGGGLFFL